LADNILNKQISFRRKEKYPAKRSMNLCQLNEDPHKTAKTWAVFAVYLVCLALFVQFGVMGPLRKIDLLQSSYETQEQQLSTLQNANSDYEEVRAEYSHYGNGYLNDEESVLQDRLDMINVVESQLLNKGALAGMSIEGNTAELTINSEKLGNVSEIVASLEKSDIVSYVTVSTSQHDEATEDSSGSVLSTMTIVFRDVGSDSTEAAAASPEAAQ
jgi:hypothetical protein